MFRINSVNLLGVICQTSSRNTSISAIASLNIQPLSTIITHTSQTNINVSLPISNIFTSRAMSTRADIDKIIRARPTTPGQRHLVKIDRSELWKGGPVPALSFGKRKQGGRNNQGRITVRHQGGGHKRRIRIVDFKREHLDQYGQVVRLEYDPNRSAHLALLKFPSGALSYVIATDGMKAGDQVIASRTQGVEIRPGNTMPIAFIPAGSYIHNIELQPGLGAKIARAAGSTCQIVAKDFKPGYALIKLHSKEQRLISMNSLATIGSTSNPMYHLRQLGKAGRARWLGIRPSVRGMAMNPVDHPHGGGQGKAKGRVSQSPTGVLAKGYKTRNKRKLSNRFIYQTRHKAREISKQS